jgi:DDE family transposase
MATPCITQTTFRFHGIPRPVVAQFDQPHASSDGGAVLLQAVDGRLGLTAALAACIRDERQPGKISHSIADLLRQRVFGLACGYADCNDAARLAEDPMHKLLLGRDPLTGAPLGSQPTLSRFENAVTTQDLYRMGERLAATVLDFHQARVGDAARRITIDVDATEDPTHGQQEFAFFNAFYDSWCYLPLIATVAFNDERDQFLVAALLRPGTGAATRGVRGLLRRVVDQLRARFPRTCLRVRLDAGFAHPKLLDWLEAEGLEYVIGVPSNPRLAKRVRRLLGRARVLSRATGDTIRLYGETRYAAKKWSHRRRIIMKAEVIRYPGRETKSNPRFVVTNLGYSPEMVYAIYCERGDMENRIKELKYGLSVDRTSCSRFLANQFRLLLSAAAYVLFQTLQTHARGTALADAQVPTLRDRLLKVAVWVERSVRRIVLHFPQHFPWLAPWRDLAAALGAT